MSKTKKSQYEQKTRGDVIPGELFSLLLFFQKVRV